MPADSWLELPLDALCRNLGIDIFMAALCSIRTKGWLTFRANLLPAMRGRTHRYVKHLRILDISLQMSVQSRLCSCLYHRVIEASGGKMAREKRTPGKMAAGAWHGDVWRRNERRRRRRLQRAYLPVQLFILHFRLVFCAAAYISYAARERRRVRASNSATMRRLRGCGRAPSNIAT